MNKKGFTLIEILIAIVILSVGLLALAGTAAVIMTTLTSTQSRTIAAAVADSRFDRIGSTACASRASGSSVTRGVSESWMLTRLARADDVTVSVTFLTNHQRRTETFKSYIPC